MASSVSSAAAIHLSRRWSCSGADQEHLTAEGYARASGLPSVCTTPSGVISAAIVHVFALFVAVSIGANISGGHVNPTSSNGPPPPPPSASSTKLLLAVGTKLEHVITQLAHEVAEKHIAIEGELVVQPSDNHFWFHRARKEEIITDSDLREIDLLRHRVFQDFTAEQLWCECAGFHPTTRG
ncbi:unnamed protein product [Camellia sinensis]